MSPILDSVSVFLSFHPEPIFIESAATRWTLGPVLRSQTVVSVGLKQSGNVAVNYGDRLAMDQRIGFRQLVGGNTNPRCSLIC